MVVNKGDAGTEGDERGKALVVDISNEKGSNNPISSFYHSWCTLFHSVDENINVVYSPIHYVDPQNYPYVGDDDVAT